MSLRTELDGDIVVAFAHDLFLLMVPDVIEELDEMGILEVGGSNPVRNCPVTTFRTHGGRLRLEGYNHLAPLP